MRAILLLVLSLIALPSSSRAAEPAQVEAGLGRGVQVRAADGSLSLQVRARVQARGQFADEPGDEELDEEFLIRRARLQLKGHALDPSLTYYVQLGFSNSDTEPDLRLPLRDARINWAMACDVELMVGQTKVPFNRQRTTSSSALQMVDRSISNNEFNLDRDVGAQLHSEDLLGWGGRLGYALGVFGGDGRNRTDPGGGMLYAARVTLSPMGPLASSEEADLGRGPLRAALGLAGAVNQGTKRARGTHGETLTLGRVDTTHAAMDLAVRWRGASLNAEALLRRADRERLTGEVDGAPAAELTRSGWGYMVQGGYLLTEQLELTARHSAVQPLGASAIAAERESGGGVSWYVREQALKVQADYLWRDGDARTGAHQVRVQVQLFL